MRFVGKKFIIGDIMMKIRNCLLVSISYIGLCSLAQANISEGGKEFGTNIGGIIRSDEK